jgi:hypothetical protein
VSAAVTCWLRPVRVVCQEFVCDVSSDFPPGWSWEGCRETRGEKGGGGRSKLRRG